MNELTVPEAVKALHATLGSAQKLADRIQVALSTVQRWESGAFVPSPFGLTQLYRAALDHGRSDLAGVFVRGNQALTEGLPTVSAATQALNYADDFFGQIILRLTRFLADPKLSDQQRRSAVAEALNQAMEGKQFIARALSGIEEVKDS